MMTIGELLAREAIRDALARYVAAADRGRYDEVARGFTLDGVIAFGDRHKYIGREEIANSMTAAAQRRGAYADGNFQRHMLGEPLIGMTGPTSARAVTYLIVITELGVEASGIYIDQFVLHDGQWLIAHRYANMEWSQKHTRGGDHFAPAPVPRTFFDNNVELLLGTTVT